MSILGRARHRHIIGSAELEKIERTRRDHPHFQRPARISEVLSDEQKRGIDELEKRRIDHLADSNLRQALACAHEGNALLYLGAGFSCDDAHPSRPFTADSIKDDLLRQLRSDPKLARGEDLSQLESLGLPIVAQRFARLLGEQELIRAVEAKCARDLPTEPLDQHQKLAKLRRFRFIVTTNWDRLIEDSFGDECTVVTSDNALSRLRYDRTTIFKLHGDFDHRSGRFGQESRVRITQQQLTRFRTECPGLFNYVRALFTTCPVIVLGFRPDDHTFIEFSTFADAVTRGSRRQTIFVDPSDRAQEDFVSGSRFVPLTSYEFLDAFETFITYGGGTIGRSSRNEREEGSPSVIVSSDATLLSKRLLDHFPALQRADVVTRESAKDNVKRRVGERAAAVLAEHSHANARITFSCGSTLEVLVEAASPSWTNFAGTQLFAASVPMLNDVRSGAPLGLVTSLARKLAGLETIGRSFQLPEDFLELVVDDAFRPHMQIGGTRNDVCARTVEHYLKEAANADIFVLGVGTFRSTDGGFAGYARECIKAVMRGGSPPGTAARKELDEQLRRHLDKLSSAKDLQFIGDLMYRPFRDIPRQLSHPTPSTSRQLVRESFINRERLLDCLGKNEYVKMKAFLARLYCHVQSIDPLALVDAIERKRVVMVVASGQEKAKPVASLCNAGIVSNIVVDNELAEAVLDGG